MSLAELDRPIKSVLLGLDNPQALPLKMPSEINIVPARNKDFGMDTVIEGSCVVEPIYKVFNDPDAIVPIYEDTTIGAIMEKLDHPILGFEHTDARGSRKVFVNPVLVPPETKIGTPIEEINNVDVTKDSSFERVREVAFDIIDPRKGRIIYIRKFNPKIDVAINPLNKK